MPKNFKVIALAAEAAKKPPKYVSCAVVPASAVVASIYTKVHGPASYNACLLWILSHADWTRSASNKSLVKRSSSGNLIGKKCRVIRPGDIITMEYDRSRANFVLNERDRITRVYIG